MHLNPIFRQARSDFFRVLTTRKKNITIIFVTFWEYIEHFSGKNGALMWSILVGKQKLFYKSLIMDLFDDVTQNCDSLCFSLKQKFIPINRFIVPPRGI